MCIASVVHACNDDVSADPTFKENLVTTVEDLLGMNVVPVFNENDAISKGVVKATVSLAPKTSYLHGSHKPC